MKFATHFITSLLLLLAQFTALVSADEFASNKSLAEVSFEEGAGNKLFVKVCVNESGPRWFVVDTGAPTTHLDYRCAKRLRLTLTNERKINVGAGTGQRLLAATCHDVTFKIAGQQFNRQSVSILELQHVAEIMGRRVDGLLGNDFIKKYSFEIDYREKLIRLYDSSKFRYSGNGNLIPVDLSSGRPAVRARALVDGQVIDLKNLIVDTGANASLYLSRPVVAKYGLLKERPEAVSGVISRGAGGDTRGTVVRIDHVSLEDLQFRKPVAILSQDTSGFFASNHFNGIVGAELLRRSKVIFDYSRKRMILEPYKITTRILFDKSGLLIRAKAPNFEEFEVISVLKGTPAAEAGVRIGDGITHVDGQATEQLTLVAITETLKQADGMRVQLGLQRVDERLDVELVLRDYAQ